MSFLSRYVIVLVCFGSMSNRLIIEQLIIQCLIPIWSSIFYLYDLVNISYFFVLYLYLWMNEWNEMNIMSLFACVDAIGWNLPRQSGLKFTIIVQICWFCIFFVFKLFITYTLITKKKLNQD